MKNRILTTTLLLLSCREIEQLEPVFVCGSPCISSSYGEARGMTWQNSNVGECKRGITVCPEDGGQPFCKGFVSPAVEVCDGKDNDCSGSIDESPECCVKKGPEICNGIDDDCSGTVDDIPQELCYSGDIATANKGNCKPGVTGCFNGHPICQGEVLPRPEVCNGNDDNCNGQVDEDLYRDEPVDLVFVLDVSGSMDDKISDLAYATSRFVDNYANRPDIRWAVVLAPGGMSSQDGLVTVAQNLSNTVDFKAAMFGQTSWGNGAEPTIDAVNYLCDPANPLGMNWQASKRYIVMLSDEVPQSYAVPEYGIMDTVSLCVSAGIPVLAFTAPYPDNGWSMLTSMPGGQVWPIDSTTIGLNLQPTIKSLICY